MDDIRLTSLPTVNKPDCSPMNTNRIRLDSETVIQQSDVSSSRPALLAHDALGPLLFEALDGFFFTINHNLELDYVSDNVAQYLKYSQEELAGKSLCFCVHPSDVDEFSKAWTKKDAGETLATQVNNDQQTVQSRGRTFHCRMRTNDDSNVYINMVVSVALHRDSLGSDKTFLICIARRPSLNDPTDKTSLLGFDQFSSRINLNYDIENLDASHMKCETLDMEFTGKNFRDYVFPSDIPSVERHFEEVIEKGEGKSTVYRFCLHDDVFAFINTRSKLFHNPMTGQADSILSTHTIVRLIENTNDLNGNAPTRLMKSIIASSHDLQKGKPITPSKAPSTPPIGTQFALTMLGMHKNASNSLHQHVSSTLGNLMQVQTSLSSPNLSSPNERSQTQLPPPATIPPSPSQARFNAQKSSAMDGVSSSDAAEFGSKIMPLTPSPTLGPRHSSHGNLSSPAHSLDIFFSSTPMRQDSDDLNSLLPSPINNAKVSSPLLLNNDIYTTSSSPKASSNQFSSRSSTRLRQLLTNRSPSLNESPSRIVHYLPEAKQGPESPTSTHLSPRTNESFLPTPKRRRRNPSLSNEVNPNNDILLKKLLEKPQASPGSPSKSESNHSDDSLSEDQMTDKQRSDTFLRTLLNDDVRPQEVLIATPFVVGSREKANQRSSSSSNVFHENNKSAKTNGRESLKAQLSLQPSNGTSESKNKKKQRQNSSNFINQDNSTRRKPGRPKRDPSEYLLSGPAGQNPQSNLSDNSLDALLDSSGNLEQSVQNSSPIVLRRTTRQTNSSNGAANLKRTNDHDEPTTNQRKQPKLLRQALRAELKVECPDPSNASSVTPMANNRSTIKIEPEIFEHNHLTRRFNLGSSSTSNSQSTLLRTLIRTPQTPSSLKTKENAPIYDLLQNHESSNKQNSFLPNNNSLDPLDQYLTPVTNNISTKDDYLSTLLNSDPQKPQEILYTSSKTNEQDLSHDNNRITAIANDLLHSTTLNNPSNDNFLSLEHDKDFFDCLNDASTIESILSLGSTPFPEPPLSTATGNKRSEKEEKAINEIYKTLVTSFNPGSSQPSSTVDSINQDQNPFNSITGDLSFLENPNLLPPNRTVTSDPLPPVYRQPSVASPSTYPYQQNNTQFSDCLSMDLLDSNNTAPYPPNVTLTPMTNSYPPQTPPTMMNNNPMMMYAPQTHMQPQQHHQAPPPNMLYRQPSQPTPMYNNYVQQPTTTMNSPYYSMPPSAQQQQQQQQRMSPAHLSQNQLVKRQALMQQQQHRNSAQLNQQLQLRMSMNLNLPHNVQNPQQQQQQLSPLTHRPMMNTYNDMMMTNGNGPPLQQEYHQYSTNPSLDLSYNPDPIMSSVSNIGQPSLSNRHMPVMQHQQPPPPPPPPSALSHPQAGMHQSYSNMNVPLTANIQQNAHNPNNLMNSHLTPTEFRQSEEIHNQMMNSLSFPPARSTSEYVRKQLQNTIHGRQKPASGKDMSPVTGHNSLSANLDSNQKGAYFRSQLSSPLSTPPLQTNIRPPQQGKPT